MRKRGTLIALGIFGVSVVLCGGWYYTNRLTGVTIPERRYPPDNAYPKYVQIAERLRDKFKYDPQLTAIYRKLPDSPLTPAERAYFLEQTQPLMDAYAQLVDDPCVAVYEYRHDFLSSHEFAGFREIARVESYHMRILQRERRWRELVKRAHTLIKFSHQIRNEGTLMHHLVGAAVESLALNVLRESFPQIDDPVALESIVRAARQYERFHVPRHRALFHEKYMGYSFYKLCTQLPPYRVLAREQWKTLLGLEGGVDEVRVAREVLRVRFGGAPMLAEYESLMNRLETEVKKPVWEPVNPLPTPRYAINELLLPTHFLEPHVRGLEAWYIAQVRVLGCAAAIRLHRQRTGSYPTDLKLLDLGDIAIDPFTGKSLIYRVGASQGFQIYSVGKNGKDDGGRAPSDGRKDSGDITPMSIPKPSQKSTSLTDPIWLR